MQAYAISKPPLIILFNILLLVSIHPAKITRNYLTSEFAMNDTPLQPPVPCSTEPASFLFLHASSLAYKSFRTSNFQTTDPGKFPTRKPRRDSQCQWPSLPVPQRPGLRASVNPQSF